MTMFGNISESMLKTTEGLGKVGTPEVLQAVDSLASEVSNAQDRIRSVESKLEELTELSRRSLLVRLLTFK